MSRRIRGFGLAVSAGLAAVSVGQGHAAPPAPAGPDAPASTSEADTLHWIAARTSISRAMILMVEPKAVVALRARASPAMGAVVRVDLHEELTDAAAATRSARFLVDLDCSTRSFRIVERRMYPLPDLRGEPQADLAARAWSPINEGSPVASAWRAACTPGFVYPYASLAAASVPAAPPERTAAPRMLKTAAAPARAPAPAPAEPPAPEPPGPGPTGGAYTAVLGSYSVSANAKGASDRLDRSLASQMAGHRKALTAATVKGTSYTVLTVSGFATAGEAGAFCTSARGIGLECFAKRTATP